MSSSLLVEVNLLLHAVLILDRPVLNIIIRHHLPTLTPCSHIHSTGLTVLVLKGRDVLVNVSFHWLIAEVPTYELVWAPGPIAETERATALVTLSHISLRTIPRNEGHQGFFLLSRLSA